MILHILLITYFDFTFSELEELDMTAVEGKEKSLVVLCCLFTDGWTESSAEQTLQTFSLIQLH